MLLNKISFRVRYGETDQMGVVYHGKYADYLEIGRTEWLRSLGVTYKSMEEEGVILPVINLQVNYIKSAKYDDLITVTTSLKAKPMVRIGFNYEIADENGTLLATAETTLAFMDSKRMRPIKCPDYILDKIEQSALINNS